MTNNPQNKLPGDLNDQQIFEQMIRVNHAGEYGAKRIYEGQLFILKKTPSAKIIKQMKAQELRHLKYFEQQIIQHRVRPTLLQPFWHVAGFCLGAATALLGEKAAMACTVAVEEVIDEHYKQQLQNMPNNQSELAEKIEEFRQEEEEHKEIGLNHEAEQAPMYRLLSGSIKQGCKLAIWLAKKF